MKTLIGVTFFALYATALLLAICTPHDGHIVLNPPAPKLDVQDSIVTSSVSQVGIDITLPQQAIRDLIEQSIHHSIDSHVPAITRLTELTS